MGLSSRLLRAPRPQTFLFTLPLSAGASLITLSLVLNKLSGFYGILALLTGYHLSSFQLSMYIYSLACLGVILVLSKHIKTNSPFHCLALAWLYVLDSLVNALYTAAFAVTWFLVLMGKGDKAPGSDMIKDTGGFADPKHNVSSVDVVAAPNTDGAVPGQGAVANATPADAPHVGAESSGILDNQSMNSIGVIVALWTIRAYFCLVMLSWARFVLRQHIAVVSVRSGQYSNASKGLADDPFAESKPEGQGWKGKLGRFMIALGRTYFLGADGDSDDENWVQSVGRKFGSHKHVAGHEVDAAATGNGIALQKVTGNVGPAERERRRRSGTGPPLPEVQAQAASMQSGKGEDGNGLSLKVPSE
ncbi:hypothetical protein LTR70_004164 [Exophiala xenobiotica]|uniref:DUF1753-domain-containing protein n=1 Tax=Lithohypha guttulata TaxID=1690604 RepID=A0ABR0KE41_9EURO|nr:hypothetical protein LTR24_003646 [Lithohypha guttulata]KAK5321451.1 hypothetical protein LTR70_004164 [Exophiala xenobiotica]